MASKTSEDLPTIDVQTSDNIQGVTAENNIQFEEKRDSLSLDNDEDLFQLFNERKDIMNKLLNEYKEKLNNKFDARINKIVNQYKNIKETYIKELPETYTDLMDEVKNKFSRYLLVEEIIRKGIILNLQNHEEFLDSIDFETSDDNTGLFVGNSLLNEKLFNENYDYTSFTYDNNHLLSNIMYDTIIQKVGSSNISYSISEEGSKDKDTKFINENSFVLSSLEFIGIKKQINDYLNGNNYSVFDKLDLITYKDCVFEDKCDTVNLSIEPFKSVKTLKYINSLPVLLESIFQFPPFSISNSLTGLTNLTFEKANIVNSEFIKIMNSIIRHDPLRKQLKKISFSENQLTSIDFKKQFSLSQIRQFDSIEELNFSNNRLYTFKISYETAFKQIKFVNVIDNHFSSSSELTTPKKNELILCLCNRNLFLTSDANLEKYINSLKDLLPKFKYKKLQYMSFSGLFNRYNKKDLLSVNINPDICGSLIELDLSYCGLDTDTVLEYLLKNQKLVKLKNLNLKANFIEIDFFEKYNLQYDPKSGNRSLVFLESLNLSNNSIKDENFEHAYKFILAQRNLKYLNLQMNSFGKEYQADKKKEKVTQSNLTTPKGDEKISNTISFYKLGDIVPDPNKKVSFMEFIRLIYYPDKPFRKFYLDFSTETRILVYPQLEKQKQNYYYYIRCKSKLEKHDK